METLPEIKRYKLDFDKRVVETRKFFSWSYGYLRPDEEAEEMKEELNVMWDKKDDVDLELLCNL